jgi:hypothetical protein
VEQAARGDLGGGRMACPAGDGSIPSKRKTSSKAPVNLLSRSRMRKRVDVFLVAERHDEVPRLLDDLGAIRMDCDASEIQAHRPP